ncbi:Uncharacterised protein [Mycobacteroides abscessus]|nr:Uncharacterised protein [Mycobacteroides abscessus]
MTVSAEGSGTGRKGSVNFEFRKIVPTWCSLARTTTL